MKRIKITKENFFIKSKADFKKVEKAPNDAPDYISFSNITVWEHEIDFKKEKDGEVIAVGFHGEFGIEIYEVLYEFEGKHGDIGYKCLSNTPSSRYWYTDEGVYRESDHWGKCRKCFWTLNGEEEDEERVVGFCRWEDFDGGIEIDSVGFYRTRDGKKARVDFIRKDEDFPVDFPVLGAVYLPEADRWEKESWTINGILIPGEESFFDIVDEWKEEPVEVAL